MNITGIITEYNPFHLGHKYHIANLKKDTKASGIICIMSGNFMQRGEPALLDKYNRAEIAVKNGVDLVIELPLIFAISSAEFFAEGAVKILDKTSVVNNIYFGSEHGETNDLIEIAKILANEDDILKNSIKKYLNEGLPFPKARQNALKDIMPSHINEEILESSNNILGIEYIKSLIKINSKIKPVTLKRNGGNYNDENANIHFPSATAIRKNFLSQNNIENLKHMLPEETYNHLKTLYNEHYDFVNPEKMFNYIKYKILLEGNKLKNLMDVSEGIDNKIIKEITSSNSLNELVLNIKSKRYTYTRINRILLSFFLNLEEYNIKSLLKGTPDYIRPLAFNETGCKILKEIKKAGNVEIINKVTKKQNNKYLDLDILGTKAYSILSSSVSPYDDYLKTPTLLK